MDTFMLLLPFSLDMSELKAAIALLNETFGDIKRGWINLGFLYRVDAKEDTVRSFCEATGAMIWE